MTDNVYGFASEGDIRRVAVQTKRGEYTPRSSPRQRARYPVVSPDADPQIFLARADADIDKGTSGNASLYDWGENPGDETDTGDTILVYARFVDVLDYAWLLVYKVNDTFCEIAEAECEPEERPE